jgi:copper chaperone
MAHQSFVVRGMTCEHCVRAVTEAVAVIPGTDGVTVDLTTGSIAFDSSVPVDRGVVVAAVEEAGYELAPGPR